MSTYTRRCSPPGKPGVVGQKYSQHGAVQNTKADAEDLPFPTKPVCHRREPRTHVPIENTQLDKITISSQPESSLLSQKHSLRGISETTASSRTGKESEALDSWELQMAEEIHVEKLFLQVKLQKVVDKLRENIQKDIADTAASCDQKGGEERHNREEAGGGGMETRSRIPVFQKTEQLRGRDKMTQDRRQEDWKQPQRKPDPNQEEYRDRNTSYTQQARVEDPQSPKSSRKGSKNTGAMAYDEREVDGQQNKRRWQNVTEQTRRKGAGKCSDVWEETCKIGVREDKVRMRREIETGEQTCGGRTRRETEEAVEEHDKPQRSRQKTGIRSDSEEQRGARGTWAGGSTHPVAPRATPRTRGEREEPSVPEHTGVSLDMLPCNICNRKFVRGRLEKHVKICEKVKQKHRPVYDSSASRMKGTSLEEYNKTHSRCPTPEEFHQKQRNKRRPLATRLPPR